jgi:hypothetical protein
VLLANQRAQLDPGDAQAARLYAWARQTVATVEDADARAQVAVLTAYPKTTTRDIAAATLEMSRAALRYDAGRSGRWERPLAFATVLLGRLYTEPLSARWLGDVEALRHHALRTSNFLVLATVDTSVGYLAPLANGDVDEAEHRLNDVEQKLGEVPATFAFALDFARARIALYQGDFDRAWAVASRRQTLIVSQLHIVRSSLPWLKGLIASHRGDAAGMDAAARGCRAVPTGWGVGHEDALAAASLYAGGDAAGGDARRERAVTAYAGAGLQAFVTPPTWPVRDPAAWRALFWPKPM